jgi:hypothetical protein
MVTLDVANRVAVFQIRNRPLFGKRQPEAVWIGKTDELCGAGRAFGRFRGEIPRKKFFDLVDGVLRDA